jgi:NOL1/NOP2/sun family putative RNA methylase
MKSGGILTKLPEEFLQRIERRLGEEWQDFLQAYADERAYGLRINRRKISAEAFQGISPFSLKPVPWTDSGFYYNGENKPGKHPYYHAGLYYIQEPTAMLPVELLDVQADDMVLDLCAAPGGKSVAIAGKLGREGCLVSNDPQLQRARALLKNIELYGIREVVVTNELPKKLSSSLEEVFDKILVDAPCSGEGMFRKEPDMIKEWTPSINESFAKLQLDILQEAGKMLKKGGRIVYSTCTFSEIENEGVIEEFLDKNPNFRLERISLLTNHQGITRPSERIMEKSPDGHYLYLWPHHVQGEGHFVASLRKEGIPEESRSKIFTTYTLPKESMIGMKEFFSQYLVEIEAPKQTYQLGSYLYELPSIHQQLSGIKVIRHGWQIGEMVKGRFLPTQALLMALNERQLSSKLSLAIDDERVIRYLKGETLFLEGNRNGWLAVLLEGYPLGWGKLQQGQLKNYYPPAWRWI